MRTLALSAAPPSPHQTCRVVNVRLILVAAAYVQMSGAALGDQWGNVVLRDDFDGPGSTPDTDTWVVNHPDSFWWVQGRTFFPSPIHHPAAPFPYLNDGKCVIQHHLHNPYHLGTPKTTFLGGEIRTVMQFDPSRIYRFEARVRCNTYPGGLVTSFFTYGYDGSNSDEIDFEFLSKQTNDNSRWPAGDPVVVNTWDEGAQCPQYATDTSLDLAVWNTFRIYWHAGERVDWTWINPGVGEVLLRTEASQCLPDQAMSLYFNFWAAQSDWADAHDAGLQPVSESGMNEIHTYEIDYVEVRVPLPGLEIKRIGNDCELYWPTNVGAGFTLESTTDLNPGTIWSPVPDPVAERDDHYVVTVPIGGGVVFFRLAR